MPEIKRRSVAAFPDSNMLMRITDEEFGLLRSLIYKRFGINLTDQKRSLLVGRLQKVLRQTGHTSFKSYYDALLEDSTEQALSQLVDRISTNHTYFYREKSHFDFFIETALPRLKPVLERQNNRDIRIWCAGCSSGEEAYMLLMLLREYLGSQYSRWDGGILATDISSRVLDVARRGIYAEDRLRMLPEHLRRKYFRQLSDGQYEVVDDLRQEATFRRFNLMNDVFPFKKPFHIIFCRNVMIYFDDPTRKTLVAKFHKHTADGGYFFLGHSETLGRGQSLFKYLAPAVYQKQ
jgi:chemotaxis protein methyltransferase CheR